MIDNWTLGRKIAAGFGLSLLLLMAIGSVAYASLTKLTSTSQWVTHTHEVLEHIAGVLSLLKDAETGQRGYVITGDEALLEPYHSGSDQVPTVLKELRKLTAGQSPATEAPRCSRAARRRKAGGTETDDRSAQGRESRSDGEDCPCRRGQATSWTSCRRILDDMEAEERGLLQQREEEGAAAANGAKSVIIFGTLFCLALRHRRRHPDHAILESSDRQLRRANPQFLDRAAGGRQSTGDGDQGAGDRHERDQHHHQRAIGDLATDRRELAARRAHRGTDRRRRRAREMPPWPLRTTPSRPYDVRSISS